MTSEQHEPEKIELIDIADINILNPRTRNKRLQQDLIESIQAVGLKRPITVSRTSWVSGRPSYDLVCGQGRLEAFLALGERKVPAIIIRASKEDCLVMSLVENVARRHHQPIDLMREIGQLRSRGHNDGEIAKKIGVTPSWVNMIGSLLDKGEEKLLAAVDMGIIPVSMATEIAKSSSGEIQAILSDAYEQGFRGKRLSTLRKLLEQRSKRSKMFRNPVHVPGDRKRKMSAVELRRIFEKEAERQRLLAKKATFTHDRLVFSVQALKELHANSSFKSLLRTHALDAIPKLLADRMRGGVS
ncbi:plasmid partitioning protein RepB C-terminal domain-containing protein [Dyella sp.]|uniref:plasmid partitioning protein RepB C-terminal domain-containing protein n=1 Tax=Dyella sp. TaxID=1869338 RepID=UPI00284B81FB|nr:plasmid partitioning protein RepB C-terminal domain-containing protein [Dyella sp.]MDR3445403.1 plasmid partitioning protein RepB C-terminal domain-containing protein [Dyella sp.]